MTISDKAAKLFSGLDPIWGGETFHASGRDRLLYMLYSDVRCLWSFAFCLCLEMFNNQISMAKRQNGEVRGLSRFSAGKLRSPTGYMRLAVFDHGTTPGFR